MAGQHNRTGAADRHRHPLDLFRIGVATDDENRARLHLRGGPFRRGKNSAMPLADDGHAMSFANSRTIRVQVALA